MKNLSFVIIVALCFASFETIAMRSSLIINSCFSGGNLLKANQGSLSVEKLKVGDSVIVDYENGVARYEKLQAIKKSKVSELYAVEILNENGDSYFLELTGNHYVFTHSTSERLIIDDKMRKPARNLKIGDYVLFNGIPTKIVNIESQEGDYDVYGLVTKAGTIEVNGVLCSCETTKN